MKNGVEFEAFLIGEVNLNPHRIDTLTQRVETISGFLKNGAWGPYIRGFSPQGSWAHKTIIKPPGAKGFDADLLVFMNPIEGWSASDYIIELKNLFAVSGTYKDMVGLCTRCVTLEYAGDFTLDVVPCILGRAVGTHTYEVCNRKDNIFEPTDGLGFTSWFQGQNRLVGNDRLRHVVRLIKYLRDVKLTFSCKSILLTTLIGNQVRLFDEAMSHLFVDLPTSLQTLIGRLDDYLQANLELHEVRNPVLASESFVRHWDEEKYRTFRDMIHKYRGWVDEAYAEKDAALSLDKWQRVFGDEFGGGKRAIVATLTADSASAIGIAGSDVVESIRQWGATALINVREKLPWVKSPPWTVTAKSVVAVSATGHHTKDGPVVAFLHSGQLIKPGLHLRFEAVGRNDQRYASMATVYEVQWQVVNTGAAAYRVGALRGGFEKSDPAAVRWERSEYHGLHWIQAFLIRKRDRACIGHSERYFVVVQ